MRCSRDHRLAVEEDGQSWLQKLKKGACIVSHRATSID